MASSEITIGTAAKLVAWVDEAGSVLIVESEQWQEVARFDVVYSPGGRRLALVPGEPPVLVTADYHEGMAGYDARTGAQLWARRKDVAHVQHVAFVGGARPTVAITREGKPGASLNPLNGKSIHPLRGASRVFGQEAGRAFVWTTRRDWQLQQFNAWVDLRSGPAARGKCPDTLMAAELDESRILLGWANQVESRRPDGALEWTWPVPDARLLHGVASAASGGVWAWTWDPVNSGPERIHVIDTDGTELSNVDTEPFSIAIVPRSDLLLTTDRRVLHLPSLELLRAFQL